MAVEPWAMTEVPNAQTNRRVASFIMDLRALPKIDIENIEDVNDRITLYSEMCKKYGIAFQLNGVAAALGMSKQTFLEIVLSGRTTYRGKTIYPEVRESLTEFWELCATFTEASINEIPGNPVGKIFLMKNHFDYTDSTNITYQAKTDRPQFVAGEIAAQKYASLVGAEIISVEDVKQLPEAPCTTS